MCGKIIFPQPSVHLFSLGLDTSVSIMLHFKASKILVWEALWRTLNAMDFLEVFIFVSNFLISEVSFKLVYFLFFIQGISNLDLLWLNLSFADFVFIFRAFTYLLFSFFVCIWFYLTLLEKFINPQTTNYFFIADLAWTF